MPPSVVYCLRVSSRFDRGKRSIHGSTKTTPISHNSNTQAVTFARPGLLHASYKFGIGPYAILRMFSCLLS